MLFLLLKYLILKAYRSFSRKSDDKEGYLNLVIDSSLLLIVIMEYRIETGSNS